MWVVVGVGVTMGPLWPCVGVGVGVGGGGYHYECGCVCGVGGDHYGCEDVDVGVDMAMCR